MNSENEFFSKLYVPTTETDLIERKILDKSNHLPLIIVGSAGSGKSTLLRYMIQKEEIKSVFDRIFIYSVAKFIKESKIDIINILYAEFQLTSSISSESEKRNIIKNYIDTNKVLLMIDDMDYLPNEIIQEILFTLRFIFSDTQSSKLIITLREGIRYNITQYDLPTSMMEMIHLTGLNKNEFKNILEKRLHTLTTEQLSNKLFNSIGGNPLLLNMVTKLLNEESEQNKSSFLNAILHNLPPNEIIGNVLRNVFNGLSEKEKSFLNSVNVLEKDFNHHLLKTFSSINDDDELLDILMNLTSKGILVVNKSKIEFAHKSIQELIQSEFQSNYADNAIYITFNPAIIDKNYVVKFLSDLNSIYNLLSNDELEIKEDEVGHFFTFKEVHPL